MDHLLQLISPHFKSKNPSFLHLLFAILTLSLPQTFSTDPQFDSCAPKTCGNNTPSISYPFWIDTEHSYCGSPNFQITCKADRPVLSISDDDYIIEEIFYSNNSVLVANAAAYDQTCPTNLKNMTLDRTPFNLSTNQVDFFFLVNCSAKPENYPTFDVGCATNDVNKSFGVFHVEELRYVNYSVGSCRSVVRTVMREGSGVGVYDLVGMNYSEILGVGFVLDWTAHSCSDCEENGGRCGYDDDEFVCFCEDGPQPQTCNYGKKEMSVKLKLGIGLGATFVSVALMLVLILIYLRRKKTKRSPSLISRNISSDPSSDMVDFERGNNLGVHLFSYYELQEATSGFDSARELGDGGFGTVYYGKLKDGRVVAVKRLYEHNYKRVTQFLNEVEILTRLRHKNLVSLYGCTSTTSRELLLVYEYVPNGTVADHLHGARAKPGNNLPWPTRLKIAVETAAALSYLHASDIIHRDVKTTNILVDDHFSVKVADFGLSRLFPADVTHVSTAPQGTPGYVDPDYHQCYQLTVKSDVYSFGVVLIELVSSKPAVDITRRRREINLATMAIDKIQGEAVHELVDASLGFGTDRGVRKAVEAVAELAFGCLQGDKDLRPSMVEVLEALKRIRKGFCNDENEKGVSSDGDALLKNDDSVSLSPDSVIGKWRCSRDTTPDASL